MKTEFIPPPLIAYGLFIATARFLSDPEMKSADDLQIEQIREPLYPNTTYNPSAHRRRLVL